MHTSQWDRERFRDVLEELQERTKMSQADLADLAGRNRTQINRWVRAENQPGYAALQRLVTATSARYPDVAPLARELMEAAGYGSSQEPPETADSVEAKATEVPPPVPAPEPLSMDPLIAAMKDEVARLEAQMSPRERAAYERAVREETEDYERRQLRRRLLYAKLTRGEPLDETD